MAATDVRLPPELEGKLIMFGIEHSYFCGKTRAYLRYKQAGGALQFEEIVGTSELRRGLLMASTKSPALPQVRLLDGRIVQDTSDIYDVLEGIYPDPPAAPTAAAGPRQRLAAYLIEFMADEWFNSWAFHARWHVLAHEGRGPGLGCFGGVGVALLGTTSRAHERAVDTRWDLATSQVHEPREPRRRCGRPDLAPAGT